MNHTSTITILLALAVANSIQDLRPIYDARKSTAPQPGKISSTESAVLKRAVQSDARRFWGKRVSECDRGFEVIDVAQGSFTQPQATQKAVSYMYCSTTRTGSMNGIAVFENGGLVAHLVYEGGTDSAIGALPDINGNGLSEILIAGGNTYQGEWTGGISIIELAEKGVKTFGQAQTSFSENCALDEHKGRAIALKLYVEAGPMPTFYREIFSKGCGEKGIWSRSETVKQFALERDETRYSRLR